MTRYCPRGHIPRTPHTNCTKRTPLRNNSIHCIRSFFLFRILLGLLPFKLSPHSWIRRLLTPSRNYPFKPNGSTAPKHISAISLWGIYYMGTPQPDRGQSKPYNTSFIYHHCLRPLFYSITSIRVLWNTICYFRRCLRFYFLYSNRISRPPCYYWLNIFNRLLLTPNKFPLYLKPPFRFWSRSLILTFCRCSMIVPICIYLLMRLMFF